MGRTFLHSWLERVWRKGVQVVYLEVRQCNRPAIAMYEAFGFETMGVGTSYYDNREDALLMTLWLSNRKDSNGKNT